MTIDIYIFLFTGQWELYVLAIQVIYLAIALTFDSILWVTCYSYSVMQNISLDKREDDLDEGVLSVSLLKHQVHHFLYECGFLFLELRDITFWDFTYLCLHATQHCTLHDEPVQLKIN